MKRHSLPVLAGLLILSFAVLSVGPALLRADDPPAAPAEKKAEGEKKERKPGAAATTYHDAPAAAGEIEAALKRAKRDNKHVLLLVGADWCPWCHMLHHLFETDKDIGKILRDEYEVVLVDVGARGKKSKDAAVLEKYGNPQKKGVPVLLVLGQDGEIKITQETGSLEGKGRHDPERVMAFLKKWKPKPQSAEKVLAEARKHAAAENKRVFLHFSAPWCIWCHRFEDYLASEDIARILEPAFVVVKIDQDRMEDVKDIVKAYRPDKTGVPFFVILDAQGKKLADSMAPEGNVGCPVEPHEIAHYLKVVSAAAPTLTKKDLAALEAGLVKLRPQPKAAEKPAD